MPQVIKSVSNLNDSLMLLLRIFVWDGNILESALEISSNNGIIRIIPIYTNTNSVVTDINPKTAAVIPIPMNAPSIRAAYE